MFFLSLLNALPNDLQISGEVCFAVVPFVLHARLSQYFPLHAQSGILDVPFWCYTWYIFVALCVFLPLPPPPFLRSDIEEKRTASQPSLCEDSKLCTDDALDDYANSNSVQTEVLMDESLASQSSGVRDVPDPETQESSPLNPGTAISHLGLPNSANFLD